MAIIDGLSHYWKFDEGSGNLIDAHGSEDGTPNNMTYGATGIINDAYTFNGTTSNVTGFTESSFEVSGNFTYNCWIKTDDTDAERIACKDDGVAREYLFYILDGEPWMTIWRSGVVKQANTATANMNDDAWHMLTFVNDGTDLIIYVDGAKASGVTGDGDGGAVDVGNDNFVMGYRPSTGAEDYQGEMDETGFWIGTAKTPTEITALYNSGAGLAYPFTAAAGNSQMMGANF